MKLLQNDKLVVLADQAVFSGTSFILTILTARILSIEDFGLFAGYLLGIYLFISGIAAFVVQPFQVYIGKSNQKKFYVSFAVWFQLATTLTILVITYFIGIVFKLQIPLILILYALGFIFHDFGRRVLLALNQTIKTLILDASASFTSLLGIFYFYYTGADSLKLLLLYLSIAYSIPFFLGIGFLEIKFFKLRLFKVYLAKHFRSGKWLFLSATTQWWSGNLYVVASGVYLGAQALGALRLAQSLMGVLNVLLQAFENYVLPQTSTRINTNLSSGLHYLVNISRKVGLLFVVILSITFVFSKSILSLAGGEEYISYAFVLQGFAVMYLLVFISQPIRLVIRSLLLDNHFFYGYLISFGFALGLSHFLLSNYELKGAVIGLALSQFILIVYWSLVLQKRKINLWKLFISF